MRKDINGSLVYMIIRKAIDMKLLSCHFYFKIHYILSTYVYILVLWLLALSKLKHQRMLKQNYAKDLRNISLSQSEMRKNIIITKYVRYVHSQWPSRDWRDSRYKSLIYNIEELGRNRHQVRRCIIWMIKTQKRECKTGSEDFFFSKNAKTNLIIGHN